jgi:hypothetical protein
MIIPPPTPQSAPTKPATIPTSKPVINNFVMPHPSENPPGSKTRPLHDHRETHR